MHGTMESYTHRPLSWLTGLVALAAAMPLLAAGPATPQKEATRMALTPQEISRRIESHRTAQVTLTVTDVGGGAVAGQEIRVRMTRHKFLFGCNFFGLNPNDASEKQKAYRQRFTDLLNFATLPFYWGSFERTAGKPDTQRLAAMARWCRDKGIAVKGHPLAWHQVAPRWHEGKDEDEMLRLQTHRVAREVAQLAGLVDCWDVVNEAVVCPTYKTEKNHLTPLMQKHGREAVIKAMFDAAVAANPRATLLLNDYDTTAAYADLIGKCLEAGVRIDVIGIQSHMHAGYWGPEKTWEVCQRFARFGKPLHFTEMSIVSGPPPKTIRWHGPKHDDWLSTPEWEQQQAAQVVETYTLLFSHPSVEAITWWDLPDGQWLGAPSGLVRADMTPKPAYDALMRLVKGEWWTDVKLTTDAQGRAAFRGYLGAYEVTASTGKATFVLDQKGQRQITLIIAP